MNNKLPNLYNIVPIPILIWSIRDDHLILIDANTYALEITDRNLKKFYGCYASEIYHSHQNLFKNLTKCAKTKSNFTEEIEIIPSDDTSEGIAINIKFYFFSPNFVFTFFYNEFPNRILKKLIGFEDVDISNQLDSEKLRKLKYTIPNATRLKQKGIFYRDIFIHDLNNLLSNIQASTQLCVYYLKKKDYSQIIELCDLIKSQVNKAKKVIDNAFTFLELEEGHEKLRKVDIFTYLNNSIEYIHKTYLTREIQITIQSEEKNYEVFANELLEKVFDNLLLNAVKYNDKEIVKIIIRISRITKKGESFIKIEVMDNGIGISDERKKKIFIKDYWKSQDTNGMGIGLSLVKRIIKIFHGTIWVENRVKQDYKRGSNFIILLPAYT